MEILILLVIFAAGYFVGEMHATFKIVNAMKKIAEEQGIDLDKEVKSNQKQEGVHKLTVERHGDMLYLFDRQDDNFICQAPTLNDLAKLAKDYKQIKLATVVHDDKVFMFVDGNSKEYTG